MITTEEVMDLVRQPYKVAKMDGQMIDCFSLVHWIFTRADVDLPVSYIPFLQSFRPIKDAPRFLDVVAMSLHPPFIDHIGVMLNDREFIHARRGMSVVVSKIQEDSFQRIIKGILRYKEWMS